MSIRAAIDCGSNTLRLLIVDDDGKAIARDLRTTRLGHRIDVTGELAPESIDKTLFALADFKNQMEAAGVEKSRAVATSAVRDAANASELLANASAVLGHELEVLSGAQEANLAYSGAMSGRAPGDYFFIDIGGGSTEFAVGDQSGPREVVSVNAGCVRVAERFFNGGPYTSAQFNTADEALRAMVRPHARAMKVVSGSQAIGVAGTITTLAAVIKGVDQYAPGAVHGFRVERSVVDHLFDRMVAMTPDELAGIPGMPEERVPVIVAGTAILRICLAEFALSELLVSETDILDAIAAGL